MANPQLTVEISAKIDGLRDSFNQAIKEINGLDSKTKAALSSVDKGFEKLANDIDKSMASAAGATNKASSAITKNLANAAKQASAAGQGISIGSNQAAFALTNLGRVAQDAPFGFIGIQNNLNPLLESFQRLRAESGSNSAALKALGQSLIGPAGLGLALSVVSAGILIYQQYQQRSAKATENARKANEDYAKSLEVVRQSQLLGTQNVQEDLINLRLLYKAYQDSNLPLKERKNAYKQLQDQYPAYFGNLKFEKEASDKTKTSYDTLTQSILATGRARAAVDLITQNSKKQLENEQKINDLVSQQIRNQRKLRESQQRASSTGPVAGGTAAGTGDTNASFRVLSAQEDVLEVRKQINGIQRENNKLTQENLRLEKAVNVEIANGAMLTGSIGGEKLKNTKARNLNSLREQVNGINEIGATINFDPATFLVRPLNDAVTAAEIAFNKLRNEFGYTSDELANLINTYDISLVDLLSITENFNSNLSEILNNGIGSTLSGLGDAIGTALSSGANAAEAAGVSLLSSLGDILIQLGKLAIGTGIAVEAIKTALKSLTGVGAIAAGIALVALGSAVRGAAAGLVGGGKTSKSDVKPIRGFATGGQNIKGGVALVGENGPEIIDVPSGSDIYNNTKTRRMMGAQKSGEVVIGAQLGISMRQLVVAIDQEKKLMGRQ